MRQVENILAPLKDAFAADGVDLSVLGIDGGRLRLGLCTDGAECAECIVPDEMIESMVLARIAAAGDVSDVAIDRVKIEHVAAGAGRGGA